jgi:hypothetical protein
MIDRTQLQSGVLQYTYWDKRTDVPWGILWVRQYYGENKKRISLILDSMTSVLFRRRGVCRELYLAALADVDVLLTASGSEEGGREFLMNFGFIYNKDLDIWSFHKGG